MSILKYLKPIEAADILSVSPPTIIAMCNRGEFPNAKLVGKRWRIPETDIKRPSRFDQELEPAQFDSQAVFQRWEQR